MAQVNHEAILRTLTEAGCMYCNFRDIFENRIHERCNPCYIISSSAPSAGKPSRMGLTTKSKKMWGVEKPDNIGKCQAFLFSYYPNVFVEFKYPEVPDVDVLGKVNIDQELIRSVLKQLVKEKKLKTLIWVDHHIDGCNWNDEKSNHGLCLSTEHGLLHHGNLNERQKAELIQCIIDRNRQLFGTPVWGDED